MDDAGHNNVEPRAIEATAPPDVEAPAPPVKVVVDTPIVVPAYVTMELMSLALAATRYWCDLYKGYTLMPYTLEYNYSLPSTTLVDSIQVAASNGVPSGVLDLWFIATEAAPCLMQ